MGRLGTPTQVLRHFFIPSPSAPFTAATTPSPFLYLIRVMYSFSLPSLLPLSPSVIPPVPSPSLPVLPLLPFLLRSVVARSLFFLSTSSCFFRPFRLSTFLRPLTSDLATPPPFRFGSLARFEFGSRFDFLCSAVQLLLDKLVTGDSTILGLCPQ